MIKTLHIDTGRKMGGGQWQVKYLFERLDNATLLAPRRSPFASCATPLSFGILARLARSSDLVHAHDARGHTLAAIAGGAPLIVSRRVAFPVRKPIGSRWKYGRTSLYLAVSKFVAERLHDAGVPKTKIRVVYDGVPIPNTAAKPQPGRVVALSNKSTAISGIPISPVTNLWEDLSTASVFLYVSEMEGLGSAALAAMASGVPVVASGVGGLPEAVEHEITGLIVRDGDYTRAVRRLLDNPGLAAEMGQAGRERVMQKFSVNKMVEATLYTYEEVLR